MKARYWTIQSKNRTYYICQNSVNYVLINNRRVDIPLKSNYHSLTHALDFQLPIDDLEIWCRFEGIPDFMKLYVNGVLVPDQDNTQPDPREKLKLWILLSCIVGGALLFALLLHFYG